MVLRQFRVDKSDAAIDAEIEAVLYVLNASKQGRGKWRDMLKGSNKRRTIVCLGTIFFNQATGQAFSSTYGAIFIKSVGSLNPFTMGIINQLVGFFGTGTAMLITDKVGRRFIFVHGAVWQTAAMFTMAALGTVQPTTMSLGRGIIAMIPVYGFGYTMGSSSVNHVITAEIPHQSLRDKTQRIVGFMNNLVK